MVFGCLREGNLGSFDEVGCQRFELSDKLVIEYKNMSMSALSGRPYVRTMVPLLTFQGWVLLHDEVGGVSSQLKRSPPQKNIIIIVSAFEVQQGVTSHDGFRVHVVFHTWSQVNITYWCCNCRDFTGICIIHICINL